MKEEEAERKFNRDLVRNQTFYLLLPNLTEDSPIKDPGDLNLFRFNDEAEKEQIIETPNWAELDKSIIK